MTDAETLHAKLCAYVDSQPAPSERQRCQRAGETLGVHENTIRRWMLGQRRIPVTVGLLLDAYGVSGTPTDR
jgi:hypothetical protein